MARKQELFGFGADTDDVSFPAKLCIRDVGGTEAVMGSEVNHV